MRKLLLLSIYALLYFNFNLQAQSCFNVAAGNDTTISCLQSCLNLNARIPDLRTTETYKVISIPYAPYLYKTPGGTTDPLVNDDDHFSNAFALPFPFCFYGNTYGKLCVGSNGVLTFDVTNANKIEGYFMRAGDSIWFNGGNPDEQNTFYPPPASIFLGYYDMNPATSPPESKIEWRVEGSAPCRRFVVSFYHIGFFENGICPNNNPQNLCTMQAVLYEGSGIIDVFYENKPTCAGSSHGAYTIAGVQNFTRNEAVCPPGKNGTIWTAINEGYRYVPSGPTSLLDSVSLFKNGAWMATGTTSPLGNGELQATFTNICQTEDSMSYVVRAFYRQCDNPAVETEGSDTIIVYKTLNPIATNIIPASCPSSGTGQISVTSPVGANIEYSADGTTWQTSPVFNLPAGTYTILARVIGSTCTGDTTVIITSPAAFFANAIKKDLICNGQNTGEVSFNPTGPLAPFEFSSDAGVTYQTSGTFSNLAANTYTFRIKNGNGCTKDTTIIITQPSLLIANSNTSQASCANTDGSISINATGGTPLYNYSIDNGVTYQPGNIFSVAVGNYPAIKIKDANGCIANSNAIVTLNDTMRLELGADSTICAGSNITLQPQTNPGTDVFKWSPAATLNTDTIKNPIATPVDTIKYYLIAQWGICQRTDSVVLNVLKKPVANAGSDTIICYKTNATLKGTATNLSGGVDYNWTPAATLASPNMPTTLATPDTTQQYYLTITDKYGCNFSVTDSVWVIMQAPVNAFAGNDTNAIKGRPHQLMATGGTNYLWSPAGPLNNPFIQNPLATLYNDTYFSVLVTDAIGCIASDDVFIKVYEGPMYYLPNSFTPNGDGLNDIFRPIPVGIRSTDYFRVFNRFGTLMYETRQWMQGWDGTLKGKPANSGTYVWMIKGIDKNGAVIEMKGTVILLR
ncbi:MAG TPA: gliding motility-associated C-terminal domain-containing protein [Ferruginibacter sp.]|nr:gliding motility-associated C-terminal domain-containing protein [Ferruginibacter sp.]